MRDGEQINQLHGRFKKLLNDLHSIGEKVENRDLIKYAFNAFPKTTLRPSIVDEYKVSRDLSIVKLNKLFCEFELCEQSNTGLQDKGIALVVYLKAKATTKSKRKEKKQETPPKFLGGVRKQQ